MNDSAHSLSRIIKNLVLRKLKSGHGMAQKSAIQFKGHLKQQPLLLLFGKQIHPQLKFHYNRSASLAGGG